MVWFGLQEITADKENILFDIKILILNITFPQVRKCCDIFFCLVQK